MLGLLATLLLFCLIIWGARTLLAAFDPGPQISAIVYVFIVIVAVLWLLDAFNIMSPSLPFRR